MPLLNALAKARLLISSNQYNAITTSRIGYVTPTSSYLSTALAIVLKPSAETNSQRSKMLTNTRHFLAQSHATRDVCQQQLQFAPSQQIFMRHADVTISADSNSTSRSYSNFDQR
ncbi:hypothetical protein F511_40675 [Dorcoceras hygrometricum]|uniref:Uncharacterized protein n=1 Tax=Dorcoceras hygrometricum TaxID=472368 RepID=A0A2Z7CJD8_9LAMI|nr:hypothetical protein F511_40675 [Dorcoceras hygrometricum]